MNQVSVFNAYAIAGGVMVLFFLLACLFSSMVNYRPDKSDAGTRKVQMILFGILSAFFGAGANWFIVLKDIVIPSTKTTYMTHMAIAALAMTILYFIVAFIVSKICKSGKLGTWF